MTVGFEVLNSNNNMLIDGIRKNVVLTNKVTISRAAWVEEVTSFYTVYTTDVTLSGNARMLFIGDTEGAFVSITKAVSGTGGSRVYTLAATARCNTTVFAFLEQPPVDRGYGLQVFDSSGSLVFDATDKHLSVFSTGLCTVGYNGGIQTVDYSNQAVSLMVCMAPAGIATRHTTPSGLFLTLIMTRGVSVSDGSKIVRFAAFPYSGVLGQSGDYSIEMFDFLGPVSYAVGSSSLL